MRRKLVISGALTLVLLITVWISRSSFSHGPKYRAEILLGIHPFTNALLPLAFERQVISSNPGVVRLYFQISTLGVGSGTETNAVMRLVAAGSTPQEAEQAASRAGEALRVPMQQSYGITATIIGQAHSYLPAATRQP